VRGLWRLQDIEGLDALGALDQLWLGRNRISVICNLSPLTRLRQISLQANRLESMAGIGLLRNLEELYLSQNGIKSIEDLSGLTRLKVLDLAYNRIEVVRALLHFT
jgi:protein phosphatase 1 regulatory subunit 7